MSESESIMFKKKFEKMETKFNNRIIDFVIGGSYMNDFWQRFFDKIKKTGRDAYEHLLVQIERLKEWYKD